MEVKGHQRLRSASRYCQYCRRLAAVQINLERLYRFVERMRKADLDAPAPLTAHTPAPRRQRRCHTCDCYPHGCPCGYHGDPTRACTCPPSAIARYQKRISGPLLDRVDIHVEVPRVEYEKLTGKGETESFAVTRSCVLAAQPLLRAAAQRLQLSARAFHRVLKLARTIADLAGAEVIAAPHIAEALQYRPRVDVG
jgi:predicted ATPase with chaperone activity